MIAPQAGSSRAARAVGDLVVLVPGVGFGGVELGPLAWRLRRRGFRTRLFFYLPWCKSLDESAAKLAARLQERDEESIHLVGHSLGGLVILKLLSNPAWRRAGRIVTLGTPHRGIAAAHLIARVAPGRVLLGEAIRSALPVLPLPLPPGRELGTIAGDLNVGLGLLLRLPRPNDSLVAVAEASHPDAREHVVLRASHTSMLLSARVIDKVECFLRRGSFAVE